jgi:hypothetical protein
MTDRTRTLLWLAAIAAAAVWLTYAGSLHDDLFWDDYGVLRPRSWADLVGVLHGEWQAGPPFYRPLATWYYALCFDLFGLNAVPLHILSILELTCAAWLTGVFVLRETRSGPAAAFAAALFGVHPAIAFSSGPWFSNQFHLLVTLCTIGALLCWQARRHAPQARAWWPIGALVAIGCLIKEDTLMVLPALLLLQYARARLAGDVPKPTRRLLLGAAALACGLLLLRYASVGGAGRYGPVSATVVVINWLRGPYRVLGWLPMDGALMWIAAGLCGAGLVGGAIAVARRPASAAATVWIAGACLFGFANVPLGLASNLSRYHLLSLGAVLMIAGGMAAFGAAMSSTTAKRAWGAAFAAGLVALSFASREAQADYRPCTPGNLERDQDVIPWIATPPDLRAWLVHKIDACRTGTYRPLVQSLDHVLWDMGTDRRVALVTLRASAATVSIRVAGASAATPIPVSVTTDAGEILRVTLTSPDWRELRVPLRPRGLAWLRQMQRLDVHIVEPRGSAGVRLELRAIHVD